MMLSPRRGHRATGKWQRRYRRALYRWDPVLRQYGRRAGGAAAVGAIVGVGMAAFSPFFDVSPFVLGPIAGIGTALAILHYG